MEDAVSSEPSQEELDYFLARGFVWKGGMNRPCYVRNARPTEIYWVLCQGDGQWSAWFGRTKYQSPICGSAIAAYTLAETESWGT